MTRETPPASARQRPARAFALLLGAFAVLPAALQALDISLTLGTEILIIALFAMSYNILLGTTGLASFGHAAFFGSGAYAVGIAQQYGLGGAATGLVLAFAAGLCAAFVVGLLVMKKRGIYFGLLTLAFGQMFYIVALRWDDLTGGETGLTGLARPAPFGLDLGDPLVFYYFTLAVFMVALWLIWRITHSPFGSLLSAIKSNEVRTQYLGYHTGRYKLGAMVLGRLLRPRRRALRLVPVRRLSAEPVLDRVRQHRRPHAAGRRPLQLLRAHPRRRGVRRRAGSHQQLHRALDVLLRADLHPGGDRLPERPARGPGAARRRAAPPAARRRRALRPRHEPGDHAMSGLRTENLSVAFGAVKPVDDVSVEIAAGRLTSIIGPNGAGKTSFFNLLTGLYRPTRGRVFFDGADVTQMPVHRKVRSGLTRTFQILNVFDTLTVEENIRAAVQRRHGRAGRLFCAPDRHGPVEDEVAAVIERVRLREKRRVRACDLSHGHRRHLEIGLSLATRPKTLLLDEPMSGLGMYESSVMGEFVRELAQELTVVLVEHHMAVVLSISDTILVLSQGRLLASGTPAEIQANPLVQAAYLGTGRYDLPQERPPHEERTPHA